MAQSIDDFFLKHHVYKDKDPDEIGPNSRSVNSDSEASDDETMDVSSAADPAGPWVKNNIPEPIRRAAMAQHAANTGPKGVLNDYKQYKLERKMQRERDEAIRQAVIDRITKGCVISAEQETEDNMPKLIDPNKDEEDDDVLLDDPNDDFLVQFRLRRLKELQENDSRPIFGEIKEVTPYEFVEIVNKLDRRVKTVVHLYEQFVPSCRLVNNHLESIARRHSSVQFLRLNASDADNTLDHRSLPIFLVYQGGSLICTITDVVKSIEGHISNDTVEWILESNDVFDMSVDVVATNQSM